MPNHGWTADLAGTIETGAATWYLEWDEGTCVWAWLVEAEGPIDGFGSRGDAGCTVEGPAGEACSFRYPGSIRVDEDGQGKPLPLEQDLGALFDFCEEKAAECAAEWSKGDLR